MAKNCHSVAEIIYLKCVSNMFIVNFQSIFLITMVMPLFMNSLKIKLLYNEVGNAQTSRTHTHKSLTNHTKDSCLTSHSGVTK